MIVLAAMMAVVLLLAGCGKTPADVPAVETEPPVAGTVRDITDGTVTITYENGEVYTLSW